MDRIYLVWIRERSVPGKALQAANPQGPCEQPTIHAWRRYDNYLRVRSNADEIAKVQSACGRDAVVLMDGIDPNRSMILN